MFASISLNKFKTNDLILFWPFSRRTKNKQTKQKKKPIIFLEQKHLEWRQLLPDCWGLTSILRRNRQDQVVPSPRDFQYIASRPPLGVKKNDWSNKRVVPSIRHYQKLARDFWYYVYTRYIFQQEKNFELPTVSSGQAVSSLRLTKVFLHSMPAKFASGQKSSSLSPSGISIRNWRIFSITNSR